MLTAVYWDNFSVYGSTRQRVEQLVLQQYYDPNKPVSILSSVTKKLCVMNKSIPLDLFCEQDGLWIIWPLRSFRDGKNSPVSEFCDPSL